MKKKDYRPGDEIPTSSMADIAFLLIIYFMVTMAYSATKGLDFTFPEDDPEARTIDPVESVFVQVGTDGSLLVDRQPMTVEGLLPYLRPKLARNPTKPVIVFSANGAPYGAMVQVLDELRQGRQRLALAQDIVIAIPTGRERERYL